MTEIIQYMKIIDPTGTEREGGGGLVRCELSAMIERCFDLQTASDNTNILARLIQQIYFYE